MIRDGYYLFIYSEINSLLNALGLSRRHDHNMAVFKKNGSEVMLVCHLEFERFSGKKHHQIAFQNHQDAVSFINRLLRPYDLKFDDFVGIFGLPNLSQGQQASSSINITSNLDIPTIAYHSVCHLFSSMLMDTNKFYQNDMLALAFDGGPDVLLDENVKKKHYFCGAVSQKGKVEYFPIASPGVYWEYVSIYFGIPEGTLMALAYATNAKSLEKFEVLPYCYKESDKRCVVEAIQKIISRILAYTKDDCGCLYANYDDRFTESENKLSMIMKVIQELSIQCVFVQIDEIIQKYRLEPTKTILSLSGGYALNCPTNTHIMQRYHFKEQICCPCVNDGGLSIGMGLYFFHKYMGKFFYTFRNAFYGYTDDAQIEAILATYSEYIERIDEGIDAVAADIVNEPVIWLDGSAEVGPRALGHRSILANPQKQSHKDLLNVYKKREWWRPVAPIILEESVKDWFTEAFRSPYMLNNFYIKEEIKDRIPAVLHLDQSARVQTLSPSDDAVLYEILQQFNKLTGVPVICNTSLNDKGEPIINTIEQAINFALRKKIKIVYANHHRIILRNHDFYGEEFCLKRYAAPFEKSLDERQALLKKLNPYDFSKRELLIYLFNPNLWQYNLTNNEDCGKLKKIMQRLQKNELMLFEYALLEKTTNALEH